jgi:hypothetical protein
MKLKKSPKFLLFYYVYYLYNAQIISYEENPIYFIFVSKHPFRVHISLHYLNKN